MNSKLMTNKLWFMLIYYLNNFRASAYTCIYQLDIDSMFQCWYVKGLHGVLSPTQRTCSNLGILQKCKV